MFLEPEDAIGRVVVPLVGAPRDCSCPATLAICERAVCPRRAIVLRPAHGFVYENGKSVSEFAA